MNRHLMTLFACMLAAGCGGAQPTPPAASAQDQVAATVEPRSAADVALDAGRKPDALMKFLALKPGMRVAELGVGGGYTAELLARAVGTEGRVYGQNNKWILEKFAEKPWSERLQKPVMKNVMRLDTEFDAPFTDKVEPLDMVLDNMFYHDTVWMNVDRQKMNEAIFRALKKGGRYVVIDHSARAGAGLNDVKTLHRIDEKIVREEVLKAGFVFRASDEFLRNAADTRDWSASPSAAGEKRGESDRFALMFEKP